MATVQLVSSADGLMMPPATGDAGDRGEGGRDGASYPAASRHNCSRLQREPSPLQSECVHMDALMQKWLNNRAVSLPLKERENLKDWMV